MSPQEIHIVILGTLDTKLFEFLYLQSQIQNINPKIRITLIDAGRNETKHEAITITQPEVLKASGYKGDNASLQTLPRGEVIKTMSAGAVQIVQDLHDSDGGKGQGSGIHGIVSLGGTGGTSLATAAMRALPLTLPKLMVSTVASGDTSSFVEESDIAMMYSVVDIAGLNAVLRAVLGNAAAAIAGMAVSYYNSITAFGSEEREGDSAERNKKGIAITMFGVTTPAADAVRRYLEAARGGDAFDVYVFHATGAGGRAMERLVREGRIDAVLDLTTTELADELVGGVMSAGPDRLTAAAQKGIPQIVSVGAVDMVNFGPMSTVPEQFTKDKRLFFEHNPSVTLMRTNEHETSEIGARIADRLRRNVFRPDCTEVWIPLHGVSAISGQGQAFHDQKADDALFSKIRDGLKGSGIVVREENVNINDTAWAEKMAARLLELID
ncbi:hypothetical protein F5Y16DRAFT_81433 [Xylariaceae sp. FL0255]|nr:hypothetical protein F5Y16DRAFT_81433 [Xylariaceae sp. FL0255]